MTDWTVDEILTGRPRSEEEAWRLSREAMADPARVVVRVEGRNGHSMEWGIQAPERGWLELGQFFDQDDPWVGVGPHRPACEVRAPAWKRFTWEITQVFHGLRVGDELAAGRR